MGLAQLAANPQMLQQLAQQDPMFAQLAQNPQALEMLQRAAQQGGGGAGIAGGGAAAQAPAQLTEDDKPAIERLMEMGFERQKVEEVYLGCGKNEMLAANPLFD